MKLLQPAKHVDVMPLLTRVQGSLHLPTVFLLASGAVLFLLLPQFLKPLHLPFATSLILVGSIMGQNTLGYVGADQSLTLFGFLSSMFHILLAGIEGQVRIQKLIAEQYPVGIVSIDKGRVDGLVQRLRGHANSIAGCARRCRREYGERQ